jgi:uroporphyrinogen decarboxylase
MPQSSWWTGPAQSEPDFNNLLSVLRREVPARPTLFELFLNERLYATLVGPGLEALRAQPYGDMRVRLQAFRNAGYDYVTTHVPRFQFPHGERHRAQTISQNEGGLIHDRATFAAYPFPDPAQADYAIFDALAPHLPQGMQMIVCGPCGVLENVTFLTGFDNLCYLIADDEALAYELFEAVGSRLVEFYTRCVRHPRVGAVIGNDDWGFKTQPMLAPADMRRFVLPWHRKLVAAAHAAGKPAILHSCGNLASLMDDVINDLRYDGKHSYEDAILPVEQAYDTYGQRIAIMGGLDLDFICRSTPEQVHERACRMLEHAAVRGGFALGTGNSVPEYVPAENYFAITAAALRAR